jgi:hypothetical protein
MEKVFYEVFYDAQVVKNIKTNMIFTKFIIGLKVYII